LGALVETIADVISGRIATSPALPEPPEAGKRAVEELIPQIRTLLPHVRNPRWIAYRLLEGDYRLRQALLSGELAALSPAAHDSMRAISRPAVNADC
jgi:ferrous iron transport protein B